VINSTIGPISHGFLRYGDLLVENRNFFLHPSHSVPWIEVVLFEFVENQ